MIIHIKKGKEKFYNVVYQNDTFKFKEQYKKVVTTDDKYILGEDKFPLQENKYGILNLDSI